MALVIYFSHKTYIVHGRVILIAHLDSVKDINNYSRFIRNCILDQNQHPTYDQGFQFQQSVTDFFKFSFVKINPKP
jgi:hypothetical protein